MNNAISNNLNYDMPDDSFFNFYFLIHKNRIFTTKIALKVGEITTALLNMKAEDMKKIYDLTVSFAGFADNNMAMKNEQTMTEFVDRIIEIEQIAVTLPPYCYVNIDLKKEKQRAEIMKSKAFYGRLYDMTSEEFAEYERYKKLFSGYGIGLYIIACCIAEMSDEYFTRLKKRDESNYAIAWGAFNEYSTLSSELMASVPYYEKARVRETMDVNIGVSGMIDPDDKDKTWVVDTCEFHNAQSVIQYDFFRGMQHGRAPFRCHHCGRFFLATDSYKTFYCNEKSPENPNRTCNQMDFAKKKPKEKNAEKRTLLAKSEKLYHSAMTSPEFTNDEFEQQLSSASLYRLCGMEPPRKGRSGQADDRRTCKQGKDITRYEYSDWLKNLHVAKSEFSVSLRLKYLTFSDILVIY